MAACPVYVKENIFIKINIKNTLVTFLYYQTMLGEVSVCVSVCGHEYINMSPTCYRSSYATALDESSFPRFNISLGATSSKLHVE